MALSGIWDHREEIDLAFVIDTLRYKVIVPKRNDYGSFIGSCYKRKDEVFDIKYVAFLLAWVNKLLSCKWSKKATKVYLSIVVALTTSREVILGAFILNHIYKRMNDLIIFENDMLNGITRGLI